MSSLNNDVILVTGANRGQGKAIAQHLATLGAKVAIGARNYNEANLVARMIGENHAIPVQLDVTKELEWKSAVDKVIHKFGKLDVLVNNAGVLKRKLFTETTVDDYQQLININQLGVFMGMQAVIPQMDKQQKGSIINNVSISAFAPISRSEEHTSELQSRGQLVCRLLLEKKNEARSREGKNAGLREVSSDKTTKSRGSRRATKLRGPIASVTRPCWNMITLWWHSDWCDRE